MSQTDLEKAQAQIDQLLHDRAELLRQLQLSEDTRRHVLNFRETFLQFVQPKGAA